MTHDNDHGVGPCVTTRARILDHARVDVAIDIHADGGPPDGRGFAVLEPVSDGPNDKVIHASRRFGAAVRSEFARTTKMPVSTYDGTDGISRRDDLAGLNLTTVPKVLVECGNMRNPTDAALLRSPNFHRRAARALLHAIRAFVHR
jgi:N-acetylmuramoyl-L-alanine amidase